MKEYAIGEALTPEEAKKELEAGRILITKDGTEKAILFKGRYAVWQTEGKVRNVLCHLVDFHGWYVMEREEWPRKEIATKENTDTRNLNKVFFR